MIHFANFTQFCHFFFDLHKWIIDSGATTQICIDLSLFSSYTRLHNTFVTLPNNLKVPVIAGGQVLVHSSLILSNVLFIFNFHVNIISVGCLYQDPNYHISLTDNVLLIQDKHQQKVIGKSEHQHGP